MKLTDGEKLILLMLSDIQKKLGINGETDPKFIESAILSDNIWGISWKYPGIPFEETETPEIVSEVIDILNMWYWLETSYQALSSEEKTSLNEQTKPSEVKFLGFDGNHESEYINVARFLIDDLERFQRFKDYQLDQTVLSLPRYKRMLEVYERHRGSLEHDRFLSSSQIIEILNARKG